jgi:hypothetical protein
MRKITVSVQDETYRRIRAWCAQRDTCISHVVQAFLNDLPNREEAFSAANRAENAPFGTEDAPSDELHFIELQRLMQEIQ